MSAAVFPRPAVLVRLEGTRHAVFEASAGTGKTFTLEHLIVDLILRDGALIDQVLVVTFTEKATCELRTRVRAKLAELLAFASKKPREPPRSEHAWVLDAAAQQKLRAALVRFEAATISTIHGFCQRALTDYAFDNGRLFAEEQIDAREAFSEAFKEVLRTELARSSASKPYLEAALALEWTIERLEELLYACMSLRGAIIPRFDEAQFARALARFPWDALGAPHLEAELKAAGLTGSSVKAVTRRLGELATHVQPLSAADRPAAALAMLDRLALASRDEHPLDYLAAKLSAASPTCAVAHRLREGCAALAQTTVPFAAAMAQRFLPVVAHRLVERKAIRGLFDFDDMLLLVKKSLEGPKGPAIVRALRERFRYALIDEFQDTDGVQWDIFRRIFFEGDGSHSLFLVGDPKQAIYRFRGGDVETYFAARDEVLKRGGVSIVLEENFRSVGPLIETCNRIFEHPHFFGGRITYAQPVRCGRKDTTLVDAAGEPAPPLVVFEMAAEGDAVLEELIAREIQRLLSSSSALYVREGAAPPKPITPSDIFVLTRSRAHGLEVGAWLRRYGIPHAYFKQEGLFETEEAAHICVLLAAIAEPKSRARRLSAYLTPFFALSLADLAAVAAAERDPLAERLLVWSALADAERYGDLFSRIVEESGILRREAFLRESERAFTNYVHLFEVLLEHAWRTRCSMGELVRALRAFIDGRRRPHGRDSDLQRLEAERHAVQIMTMHASKGLEASIVFLAGRFGNSGARGPEVVHDGAGRCVLVGRASREVRARAHAERVEEDKRLLYVALTRAKARVYLPHWRDEERLDAAYRTLNRRIDALRAEPNGAGLVAVATESLGTAGAVEASSLRREVLAAWMPADRPLVTPDPRAGFEALKAMHAPRMTTSYSRLARARWRGVAPPDPAWNGTLDDTSAFDEVDPAEGELPRGLASGVFLHAVLENVPLGSFAAPTWQAWRAQPAVAAVIETQMRRHRIDPRHRSSTEKTVYAALRAPVACGFVSVPGGLWSVARSVREMAFVYPIPERSSPRLSETLDGPVAEGRIRVERGYIAGQIDLAFEHEGRTYFVDWKSDALAAWTAEVIDWHVREHYQMQIKLYTLAMVKLLGVHSGDAYRDRFGGCVYGFVRAMRPDSGTAGLWASRPSWDDVLAWEEELVVRQDWWP